MLEIALAGNQNCGKTTLFNRLTGSSQHVGNWPGVTVEKKTGRLLSFYAGSGQQVRIQDLPGTYSLHPLTPEEHITAQYLFSGRAQVIVNVVDATHLKRNLYLTLQLMTLAQPVVIALNMMDELAAQKRRLDVAKLEEQLGVPVIPICARTGDGLAALMKRVRQAADGKAAADVPCTQPARQTVLQIAALLQPGRNGATPLQTAAALVDGLAAPADLPLTPENQRLIEQHLSRLESRTGLSPEAALTAARYRWLDEMLAGCLQGESPEHVCRLEWFLTSTKAALPIFFVVAALMLTFVFVWPGAWLSDAFSALLSRCAVSLCAWLRKLPLAPWLLALLSEGVLPGVCSVLSFLPSMGLLFLLLAALEQSGYMARAAFLMDRPLRFLGLNGRSLMPLMMGFGCTVPAVMAARSLGEGRERRMTVLLTPLMSCSAKLPVYGLLVWAFFPERPWLPVLLLYLTGIGTAAAAGVITRLSGGHSIHQEPFLLELPPLRWPTVSSILKESRRRISDFISRTFSVITLASVAVWFLESYTPAFAPALALESSMLGRLGQLVSPLLRPCGFGHPVAAVALLTGLLAKESIVSTLAVLMGLQSGDVALAAGLQQVFGGAAAAFAYLVFVLLYTPCTAALAAIRREQGSRSAVLAAFWQLGLAWCLSMIIYQLGSLMGLG